MVQTLPIPAVGKRRQEDQGLETCLSYIRILSQKKFRIPAEGSSTYSLHLPGDPEMSPWGEIRPCLAVLEGGACNQAEKSEV